jgi:hypothetical protein
MIISETVRIRNGGNRKASLMGEVGDQKAVEALERIYRFCLELEARADVLIRALGHVERDLSAFDGLNDPRRLELPTSDGLIVPYLGKFLASAMGPYSDERDALTAGLFIEYIQPVIMDLRLPCPVGDIIRYVRRTDSIRKYGRKDGQWD